MSEVDINTPEITPAMINAGVLELYARKNDYILCSAEKRVTKIFLAMSKARSTELDTERNHKGQNEY
jgi:hypothetical protein